MKVLHCLSQLPQKTGSGVYASTVWQGLQALGHENALIYAWQEPYNCPCPEAMRCYPVQFQTPELPFAIAGMSDVMPYPSTVYSEMTETELACWQAAFVRVLQKAREDFQPDLILTHHLFMLTSLVREIFPDRPVLAFSHGTDLRQLRQHPHFLTKRVRALAQLDHVFCLSHQDWREIQELFSLPTERLTILGGGYNADLFYEDPNAATRPSGRTLKLVYGGKIAHAKGVFELAACLPGLLRLDPDLELHLIGRMAEETAAELRHLAGDRPELKLYDASSQLCFSRHLRQADIFILPSYYEGLGLTAIEALASGLRVVSTAIPGLMELLGPEVEAAGAISYVEPPRLLHVDEPVAEEVPDYIERLTRTIGGQIERIRRAEPIPEDIREKIRSHAWTALVRRLDTICRELRP